MKKIMTIAARIILCAIIMVLTFTVMYLLIIVAELYTPNVVWVRLLSLVPIVFATICFELGLIRLAQAYVPCMRLRNVEC